MRAVSKGPAGLGPTLCDATSAIPHSGNAVQKKSQWVRSARLGLECFSLGIDHEHICVQCGIAPLDRLVLVDARASLVDCDQCVRCIGVGPDLVTPCLADRRPADKDLDCLAQSLCFDQL